MFPPNFVQPVDPNDPAWANCKAGAMALNVIAQIATTDHTVLNCDNTTATANGVSVVLQGATTPIPVCIQNEKDFEQVYKCDPATGNTILIRTVLNHDTNLFVTTYYDLVLGVDWVGNPADLTECTSNILESDKVKLCDDNGEFYRWFVKDNGEPTGVSFDTDLSGAAYVPVGVVGDCTPPELQLLPVCDVLTAVVGGTIPYTFAIPYNAAIDYSTVTIANDTAILYWTDFGDGYSDVGPSPDHTYEADGHYEIKSYVVTASGNKILIAAKEINVVAGVVTITGANPHVVNRTYQVSVGSAMQQYNGVTPVGTPISPDGSAYSIVGDFEWKCPDVIDELEDNAEWNPKKAADIVECEVVSGGGVVTEGVDANLNAISTLLGIPTPDNRHTLLGNTLSISSTGPSGIMATGLNVAAAGLITGAQFTFNIDLIADSDPGDPADFGIVVWDNVAGTSVTATSITSTATYAGDAQGSGLNFPLYGNPVAPQSFQVVWTGDLPAGDYTVGYILQDLNAGIGADSVNLSVTHNIVAGGTTTTKAQLVALDQCTIDALTPEPVVDPIPVANGGATQWVGTAVKNIPADSRSFTITAQAGKFDVSFDNGTTWALTGRSGVRTWDSNDLRMYNAIDVRVRGSTATSDIDIIWETV